MNGIRVRSASTGNVTVDITSKLTKILGRKTTTRSNGAFSVSDFSNGQPFFVVVDSESPSSNSEAPVLTAESSRISWSFPGDYPGKRTITFIYGIYT